MAHKVYCENTRRVVRQGVKKEIYRYWEGLRSECNKGEHTTPGNVYVIMNGKEEIDRVTAKTKREIRDSDINYRLQVLVEYLQSNIDKFDRNKRDFLSNVMEDLERVTDRVERYGGSLFESRQLKMLSLACQDIINDIEMELDSSSVEELIVAIKDAMNKFLLDKVAYRLFNDSSSSYGNRLLSKRRNEIELKAYRAFGKKLREWISRVDSLLEEKV